MALTKSKYRSKQRSNRKSKARRKSRSRRKIILSNRRMSRGGTNITSDSLSHVLRTNPTRGNFYKYSLVNKEFRTASKDKYVRKSMNDIIEILYDAHIQQKIDKWRGNFPNVILYTKVGSYFYHPTHLFPMHGIDMVDLFPSAPDITDLYPLQGRIKILNMTLCNRVTSLEPLRGTIEALSMRGCIRITDLSPLIGTINNLDIRECPQLNDNLDMHLAPLMNTLVKLNGVVIK